MEWIAHYRIVSKLGEGGMGAVYRAFDTKLNREVAIKVLPDPVANDPDYLARFTREAQILASLNHPNIAVIYGVEEKALVMELVPGQTLEERLAQPALPLDEALAIARQIAEALEAAHEKGVIHRDLKPANVKVTPEGVVKVLDFGLAKNANPVSSASPADSPTITMRATQAGVIMGTAGYMAPEQAAGKPADRRADIWSFGVVLYELLAGKKLFQGDTVSQMLASVLKDPIDSGIPKAPPPIRRLLDRCLDRNPKMRLQHIGEARIAIEQYLANPAAEPVTAAAAAPKGVWSVLPWGLAALVATLAAWQGFHARPAPPRQANRWSITGLTNAALSRDGARIAYVAPGGAMVRMMDQVEGTPLPVAGDTEHFAFSPDGQWITFIVDKQLKKVPVAGGTPIALSEAENLDSEWADNSTILFHNKDHGLSRISAAGGAPQVLTTRDATKSENEHGCPQLLPGGRTMLFTAFSNTTPPAWRVVALDLASGKQHDVLNDAACARYLSTGHLIYGRKNTLFAAPFDPKRLAFTGTEAPVVQGIYTSPIGYPDYTVADSGLLVYREVSLTAQTRLATLEWADRKGSRTPVPLPPRPLFTPRLSPDGSRVAIEIFNATGDGEDVWVYDFSRGTVTRVTSGGASGPPDWTPDGRRITYRSDAKGKPAGIYWAPVDGSGPPELLLEGNGVLPTWSPDSKTMLFTQRDLAQKKSHIWLLAAPGNGGDPKPREYFHSEFNEVQPEISPDGRWVAYTSDEGGENNLYIREFPGPGGRILVTPQRAGTHHWSRGTHELIYEVRARTPDQPNQMYSVEIQPGSPPRIGTPRLILQETSLGGNFCISPDGQRLLLVRPLPREPKLDFVENWFEELARRVPLK